MNAVLVAASIGIVACGSSEANDQSPAATDAATASDTTAVVNPQTDVIGTGNVGGPVVDPQPHPIDAIDIMESYPEQLVVRFTAGDPNCTAADATATIDGDTVAVSLQVGITEDALARSCLAGDVDQSVSVALDEGLDGRDVVAE